MKIVHTADWHIGKNLNDYSLLEDQKYYFDQFIKELSIIKPDILLIAGDIYDRPIPTIEATKLFSNILYQLVQNLNIKVFAIAGNHDSKERLSFGSELLEISGFFISGSTKKEIKKIPITVRGEKANIYMLPYFEPYHIKPFFIDEQIKTHDRAMKLYTSEMIKSIDKSEINILVGHGLFGKSDSEDISVGGSEMIDSSPFKDFDYVALGHLHNYRTAGSERIVFSGSPIKYSIDEVAHKTGFCVIDLAKDSFNIERVSLKPLRDILVVEGCFDEFFSDRNETCNDYVFVNLTDKAVVLNAVSRLKSIFPNILGLKYINLNAAIESENDSFIKSNVAHTAVTPHSVVELFSDFYKAVKDEALTELQLEYLNTIDVNSTDNI